MHSHPEGININLTTSHLKLALAKNRKYATFCRKSLFGVNFITAHKFIKNCQNTIKQQIVIFVINSDSDNHSYSNNNSI